MVDSEQLPLRILMTTDTVGGVWRYSLSLAAELAKRSAKIWLATMGPLPSQQQKEEAAGIPNLTIVSSEFALEWMPEPWRDVERSADWLRNLISVFDIDLIHLNGYSQAALSLGRPIVVVAHSCVLSWWHAVRGGAPGPDWAEYKHQVSDGLRAADYIVAPSKAMATALQACYGTRLESIRVIPNFSNPPGATATEKQPFCLAAGRFWDPAKNLPLLNSVAPQLAWPICVAGAAEGPENSKSGAMDQLLFLGSLPHSELLHEMDRASIYLHPALYEPFGLSVLEAAHARCCLVLSDIPSLRELWGRAAIFVDPRDPEQWIYELRDIISDPQRRNKMADAAQRRARRYRAEVTVNSYLDAYSSVLRSDEAAA